MDDGTALLAAIALHPDEDVPRLAYADWLDEHNFPIRAEFIRVQCEIKRVEATEDSRRYVALYRRQDELLTNHRRELLGPLGDEVTALEMHNDIRFERGFLAELRLDGERFVKHADAIAEFKPLPEIAVRVKANWFPHAFYRMTHRIELISAFQMEPDPDEPLQPVPRLNPPTTVWPRLRKLDVTGCSIGDGGVQIVADLRRYPVLTDVNLSDNEVSVEGVQLLAQSSVWPQLKSLALDYNPIGDDGAKLLADAPPSALRYLNVRYTGIGQRGRELLLRRKGWNVALF